MKPTRSILDKSFVYRNAATTDVRATFRRYLAQQKRESMPEKPTNVAALPKKVKR
jgi:hypothetical protein